MPVSQSRKFHAARNGSNVQAPPTKPYAIVHPEFRPDLKGEFTGGHKIRMSPDGQQVVDLTDAQAKFHLDQGSIEPFKARTGAAGEA